MKKNRVSILHYAGPPIIGGVEITIYHHARLMARQGFEVNVVAGRGDRFDDNGGFFLIPEIDSRSADNLKIGEELAVGTISDEFFNFKLYISSRSHTT